jgi:hypothetical protein
MCYGANGKNYKSRLFFQEAKVIDKYRIIEAEIPITRNQTTDTENKKNEAWSLPAQRNQLQ